ncbi:MAG: hydantoinase/oxoprolinase family protein [Natronomonas sp.]
MTRLGVDVGGTFTDFVAITDGELTVEKVASTPETPEEAVETGFETVVDPTAVSFFGHGTTIATNAVLEGTFAETALVTNEGFRDAIEIGRQARPDIYDLQATKPDPIVPRNRRYEVPGRLDARGGVLTPLDEAAVRAIATEIGTRDEIDCVAVSLLFSFENTEHERRVVEILNEAGIESISRSSAVLPEIREYERTLTTAMNAALKPVVGRYLGRLDAVCDASGIDVPTRLMASNGGIIAADVAEQRPVETLLSGPAAGVRGAAHVAKRHGYTDVLSMDIGGTSCDVSIVEDGDPLVTRDVDVGGYTVGVPMVDVHTVGAGGGSIASLDDGGALRVGPESAGADPGPACYGRGGTEPTVTDAHCVLGRIDPSAFVGDVGGGVDAAEAAMERLGDRLGVGPREAASGVLRVADAATAGALQVVSVERGHDPRTFALVAFGGAGPLHAAAVADDVGVPTVLVPRTAGVLSALGLLVADLTYDHTRSRIRPWDRVDAESLDSAFAELEAAGKRQVPAALPVEHERSISLRYDGQTFDVQVSADEIDSTAGAAELEAVESRFHDRHRGRYGHAAPEEPIELVGVSVRTRGVVDPPEIEAPAPSSDDPDDAVTETRLVRFGDTDHETRVYDRLRLPPDAELEGPAVIEGPESTTVVRPGDRLGVAEGTLVIDIGGVSGE